MMGYLIGTAIGALISTILAMLSGDNGLEYTMRLVVCQAVFTLLYLLTN